MLQMILERHAELRLDDGRWTDRQAGILANRRRRNPEAAV